MIITIMHILLINDANTCADYNKNDIAGSNKNVDSNNKNADSNNHDEYR
jgi:hypothetical protein